MSEVVCKSCGSCRPAQLASGFERPPCPTCGETALIINLDIHDSLTASDFMESSLEPGEQDRDWKRRWENIKLALQALNAPHTESMGRDTIHAAVQQLYSFFVQAYHLKDALIDEAPSLGLTRAVIEATINSNRILSLLADLANQEKHRTLANPPRSGTVPIQLRILGVDVPGGWNIAVEIQHGSSTLDGLTIARNAVTAWETQLRAWGLI
jgi:hypothetical protein